VLPGESFQYSVHKEAFLGKGVGGFSEYFIRSFWNLCCLSAGDGGFLPTFAMQACFFL
jgi:hypothetical protein